MRLGMKALRADPATVALLVVSKPPARHVAESLLAELEGVPAVAAFIGLEHHAVPAPSGVHLASSLEGAALATLETLGRPRPDPAVGQVAVASRAIDRLRDDRRSLRGLFSGGTLCYESMVLMSRHLGPIHSNTPLDNDWGLPAPDDAHICLDLGSEEYTQGRPHPMIDPEPRAEELLDHGRDPTTAVVLFDVVLGHGAHDDPAAVLAPACAEITARDDAPAVVAYVLGTDADPQNFAEQRAQLERAGCVLAPTNARAALLTAAIIVRDATVAEAAA
jgi:FdrA protein